MSWFKVSVLSSAMMLIAAVAVWATPTQYLVDIKHRAPLSDVVKPALKDWQRDDANQVLITSAVLDEKLQSAYADLVSETYLNPDKKRIMLSVAYSDNQRNGLAVHLPDACYPAQGFEILEKKQIPVTLSDGKTLTVNYMKTRRGARIEPLIYWTLAGDHVYRNDVERKQLTIEYALNNLIPDGLIFRVSTIDSEGTAALAMMTDFIKAFYSSLTLADKTRFFGTDIAEPQ